MLANGFVPRLPAIPYATALGYAGMLVVFRYHGKVRQNSTKHRGIARHYRLQSIFGQYN